MNGLSKSSTYVLVAVVTTIGTSLVVNSIILVTIDV